MGSLVQYTFDRPTFLANPAGCASAKTFLHLPYDAPDPCPIWRALHWLQSGDPFPAGAYGSVGAALDVASRYRTMAHYPPFEDILPNDMASLGSVEIRAGFPIQKIENFPRPILYSASRGDVIIIAATCSGDQPIAYSLGIGWEQDGERVFDVNEIMTVDGRGSAGTVIRDVSGYNHQLISNGVSLPSGRFIFDGASTITWVDRLLDFKLAGDFLVDLDCASVNVSRPTGHANRHLISFGEGEFCLGLAVLPDGRVSFGTTAGAILNGTSNIADGGIHRVQWQRTANVSYLKVDGVAQGSVSDSRVYTATTPLIGGYANGTGRWIGSIQNIKIDRF